MGEMITDLKSFDEGRKITWESDGAHFSKKYNRAATAALLCDNKYVAIVEPDESSYPNNAVFYDEKGKFVRRIQNPCVDQGSMCFDSIYPSNGKLILVAVCPRVFYECRLSAMDGQIVSINETR